MTTMQNDVLDLTEIPNAYNPTQAWVIARLRGQLDIVITGTFILFFIGLVTAIASIGANLIAIPCLIFAWFGQIFITCNWIEIAKEAGAIPETIPQPDTDSLASKRVAIARRAGKSTY